MKNIKPIALKKATILSNEEMKNLFGGSAAENTCTCVLTLNVKGRTYRQPAVVIMSHPNSSGCHSGCSSICSGYFSETGTHCTGYESTWG